MRELRSIAGSVVIKIETERLLLRNLALNDISGDYVDWLNNPEVNKYLSCANARQTLESCQAYVRSYQERNDAALVGIFLKPDQRHIGNLTLSTINWRIKETAVGISIGRTGCMGKGFAKEALNAVVAHCFECLELNRVSAGIAVDNIGSLNLFMKCGFGIEKFLPGSSGLGGDISDSYVVSMDKKGQR